MTVWQDGSIDWEQDESKWPGWNKRIPRMRQKLQDELELWVFLNFDLLMTGEGRIRWWNE